MTTAIFIVIVVLVVLVVITCVLLVAMELHQAAATRGTVERRLLETKLELRRLRKELAER
jgi:preprotein translocase subunit SecG